MLDNKGKGKVCDEFIEDTQAGSKVFVISAYFTIYAFNELRKELSKNESMKFILTEPTFIKKDKEIDKLESQKKF